MISGATGTELAALLRSARSRSLSLTEDLSDEQLRVPMLEIVNPLLWEMGHVAYFAEFWTLRNLYGAAPIIPNADSLYDSARIPHDDRWSLPLPDRRDTLGFMEGQLTSVEEHLHKVVLTEKSEYFHRLAVYHEDMHGEALVYTRQTLGYAKPAGADARMDFATGGGPLPGDVRILGGIYRIGAQHDDGFVFDNEKWAHDVDVRPFAIARAPVTNAEFAGFIGAGGYQNRSYWSEDGWTWLQATRALHPLYWRKAPNSTSSVAWERRHFDRWTALRDHEPVCHVNWFEADAFCAWSGRRLPSEAEWEVAATGALRRRYPWGEDAPDAQLANLDLHAGGPIDVGALPLGDSPFGCRQMIGNVWEWTATSFGPYPGFSPDPYKEYSEPWFGTHMVLRGGAWTTRSRLITTRWRNFYRPHRRDIITGFRTCAR